MILVDTSAWIDFVRDRPTPATSFLDERVGTDLATTEPVLMELLVGARPGPHTALLERLMHSQEWLPVQPALDYRAAVDVFHATRAVGRQPRSVQDCLIAAVAIRNGVPLAHRDADYAHIAAATGLAEIDLR